MIRFRSIVFFIIFASAALLVASAVVNEFRSAIGGIEERKQVIGEFESLEAGDLLVSRDAVWLVLDKPRVGLRSAEVYLAPSPGAEQELFTVNFSHEGFGREFQIVRKGDWDYPFVLETWSEQEKWLEQAPVTKGDEHV